MNKLLLLLLLLLINEISRRIGPIGTNIVGSLSFQKVTDEDDIDIETKDSPLQIPFQEIILLFDNTYSWFKPKYIR